jgi:rare lipoprotein A (peptidoglycan hydrolase)
MMKKPVCLVIFLAVFVSLQAQQDSLAVRQGDVRLSDSALNPTYQIIGQAITGSAGMYSSKADGTTTASGEIFHTNDFTAACNKFKFGTWLKVTNLKKENGTHH